MPSEKVLEVKKQQVAALKERIQNSCAGVIVNYEGISVADDTKLRKELREAGVEYTVIKNTLIRLALDGTGLEGMDSVLEGTSAMQPVRKITLQLQEFSVNTRSKSRHLR